MDSKIDEIIKYITELKALNRTVISSFKSHTKKLNRLIKKVDELLINVSTQLEENREFKSKIGDIGKKILTIENSISQIENYSFEHVIVTELMEIQSRSTNILLFNLPEGDDHKDLENIKNIFSDLNENILHFTFTRLGKFKSTTPDKPRPVIIHFTNQSDVSTILRVQKNLKSSMKWSNIRFSSDKTIKQREEMANLRKTLQLRRDNGEKDVIIKYVEGIPSIVKITNN